MVFNRVYSKRETSNVVDCNVVAFYFNLVNKVKNLLTTVKIHASRYTSQLFNLHLVQKHCVLIY